MQNIFRFAPQALHFCFFCIGVSAFRAGYVIGGDDAEITDWPFMVSLQSFGSHFCGGVLYDSTHVVTAGHCVIGSNPLVYFSIQNYSFIFPQLIEEIWNYQHVGKLLLAKIN